jgi:CheY-like chemotaxis protein
MYSCVLNVSFSLERYLYLLLCCCVGELFFLSVTCAKSPRQVINILNYEGGEIDIILAEVDLPVSKCFKMLKYIARNKDLRHIPIISRQPSYSAPCAVVPIIVMCFL